jgi:hypothetical protein
MSDQGAETGAQLAPSSEGELRAIFLGGAAGAVGGLLGGGILFSSVVVAVGAAVGAVAGMIAAATPSETH